MARTDFHLRPGDALDLLARVKWEYTSLLLPSSGWLVSGKVDVQKLTDHLNRLGEEGWELVNTLDTNFRDGGTRDVIAILKRPVSARNPTRL